MNTKITKAKLPHGTIKAVAEKTGLSPTTISQVINGIIISPKQPEIIKALADYLAEYKAKETEAVKALNEVLNPETAEQFAARMNYQTEKYGESSSPLN